MRDTGTFHSALFMFALSAALDHQLPFVCIKFNVTLLFVDMMKAGQFTVKL